MLNCLLKYHGKKKSFHYKKSWSHVAVICLPRKNILYVGITERPHIFNMVAGGMQITFDLASNLSGLKLLQKSNVIKF